MHPLKSKVEQLTHAYTHTRTHMQHTKLWQVKGQTAWRGNLRNCCQIKVHPLRWSFKAKNVGNNFNTLTRAYAHTHTNTSTHTLIHRQAPARDRAAHHVRFSKTVEKSSLHLPSCLNCATMLTLINYKMKLMTKHNQHTMRGRGSRQWSQAGVDQRWDSQAARVANRVTSANCINASSWTPRRPTSAF